jgi:membrane protease YdiL (CAAX protease family)
MGFYLYKIKYFIGKIDYKKLVLQLALTIVFAVLCIGISVGLKLNSPFRFLDLIFLKLLIMAPLLEELVFRGVFVEVGERAKLNPKVSLLFNPILFSISHAPALWYVGAEFHGFIGFQLLYTLGLGYLCTQARLKTKGVLAPVILHLAFNLVFYVAIIWKFI